MDLLAQRRLGDVESFGCTVEVELLGDGHEVPEVPEFHALLHGNLASEGSSRSTRYQESCTPDTSWVPRGACPPPGRAVRGSSGEDSAKTSASPFRPP